MASLASWGVSKKAKVPEFEYDVFLSWDRVEKRKPRVKAFEKALSRTHKVAPLIEGWDPAASLDLIRKSSAVVVLITQEYIARVSDWRTVKETGNRFVPLYFFFCMCLYLSCACVHVLCVEWACVLVSLSVRLFVDTVVPCVPSIASFDLATKTNPENHRIAENENCTLHSPPKPIPNNHRHRDRCRMEYAACIGVHTPQFVVPVQLDPTLSPNHSRGTIGHMLADSIERLMTESNFNGALLKPIISDLNRSAARSPSPEF